MRHGDIFNREWPPRRCSQLEGSKLRVGLPLKTRGVSVAFEHIPIQLEFRVVRIVVGVGRIRDCFGPGLMFELYIHVERGRQRRLPVP